LLDQSRQQIHAFGRRGDHQAVRVRIGRDLNVVQHPRAEQSAAFDIRCQQLQHRGSLPLNASGRCGDRRIQGRGQLGGQRIAQFEDPRLSDQSAVALIDAADQQFQFLQVPRSGADDQRVGPDIGSHGDSSGHPLRTAEHIFDRGCGPQHRFVPQTVHAQLRFRRHRLVQLGDQLLHRRHRFAPADQQEGVRFDQRGDVNLALPSADQVHGHHVQDHRQGHAVGVPQLVEVDHGHRFGAQPLDFGDDPSHLVHVRVAAAQDNHVQVGQRLDLDAVAQLPQPGIDRLFENVPIQEVGVRDILEGDLPAGLRFGAERFGMLHQSHGQTRRSRKRARLQRGRMPRVSAALPVARGQRIAAAVGIDRFLHFGRVRAVHRDHSNGRFRLFRSVLGPVQRLDQSSQLGHKLRIALDADRSRRGLQDQIHPPGATDEDVIRSGSRSPSPRFQP
jgi:hypothetical protein